MDIASLTKDMSAWKPGLVSVVMPAHNSQSSLSESVQSVLAQTYRDWELIIVDDASRDGTLVLARQLASNDPRIRVLPLEQNVGVAEARNRGIGAALGQYLAFLDSDDLWLPNKLQVQIDFMRSSSAPFSFAQYRRIGRDGSLSNPVKVPRSVDYEGLTTLTMSATQELSKLVKEQATTIAQLNDRLSRMESNLKRRKPLTLEPSTIDK